MLLAVSAVFFLYRQISGLRRNIALAKASGLPYVVARARFLLMGALRLNLHSSLAQRQLMVLRFFSLLTMVLTMAVDTYNVAAHHQKFPRGVVASMAAVSSPAGSCIAHSRAGLTT